MAKRRKFTRAQASRPYRKLFIIAVEGNKTESQYFGMLSNQNSVVHIRCLKSNGKSSPLQVLQRMKDQLKKESLRKTDEAWLVIDKDDWPDEHLLLLHLWAQSETKFGLAVSNPKFEYWLLLHFEDGDNVGSARECDERLRRHLPEYTKNIDPLKFTLQMIECAVIRAKKRDNPPCDDWPRCTGCTTVYRLVERIIGKTPIKSNAPMKTATHQ